MVASCLKSSKNFFLLHLKYSPNISLQPMKPHSICLLPRFHLIPFSLSPVPLQTLHCFLLLKYTDQKVFAFLYTLGIFPQIFALFKSQLSHLFKKTFPGLFKAVTLSDIFLFNFLHCIYHCPLCEGIISTLVTRRSQCLEPSRYYILSNLQQIITTHNIICQPLNITTKVLLHAC